MKIRDILGLLNEAAPFSTAMAFDNAGLLIGDENGEVTGVLCCLDITPEIVDEASQNGSELIVSHHPVIFHGLKQIPQRGPVRALIEKNIAAIAMHTNFDIAEDGVNDRLVRRLGLVKSGALGRVDGAENYGAVCGLSEEISVKSLAHSCKNALGAGGVRFSRGEKFVSKVAVCCGAGVDEDVIALAAEHGCGAIISGDIKHNLWYDAENHGVALIDAGHFGTEKHAAEALCELINGRFPQLSAYASRREQDPCEYV